MSNLQVNLPKRRLEDQFVVDNFATIFHWSVNESFRANTSEPLTESIMTMRSKPGSALIVKQSKDSFSSPLSKKQQESNLEESGSVKSHRKSSQAKIEAPAELALREKKGCYPIWYRTSSFDSKWTDTKKRRKNSFWQTSLWNPTRLLICPQINVTICLTTNIWMFLCSRFVTMSWICGNVEYSAHW